MARTRKTSRRKGRRTGAIEVPRALFNRIWKDTKAQFERADATELAGGDHEQRLLAAIFGWDSVNVLRPITERKLGPITVPLGQPEYTRVVGHYIVPSARYGGKRLTLRVVLADPTKSREYGSTSALGLVAGHVQHDTDIAFATKKQQLALQRAAAEKTGIPLKDIRAARDPEYETELCFLTQRLAMAIVLFAHFDTAIDEVGMKHIRETLLHELAHAMDEEVRGPWERYTDRYSLRTCEDEVREHFGLEPLFTYNNEPEKRSEELPPTPSEEVLTRYYNLPKEVTARLAQIWNHLRRPGIQDQLAWELKNEPNKPMGSVLLDSVSLVPPFRTMWKRLNTKNRKRVMRALADMAAPTLEAEAARRKNPIPNRRTSRRRKASRRTRRTSRNPRPRRTAAQQALISELWGLIHRQLFLRAQRRPYEYLDDLIEAAVERLKRQGMAPGDVEWERVQARQSAGHFEDFV